MLQKKERVTYGSMSLDIDNDGDTDLIVAQTFGIFVYLNNGDHFSEKRINPLLGLETYGVPVSLTAGDINKDSLPDLYVSTFINHRYFRSATFNDPQHTTINILLINKGNGEFIDGTKSSGLTVQQNTFLSSFIDLNNDSWQDLVVSQNTGTVRIFKNRGDLTFEEVTPPTDNGFWMGIAAGDIDNDGDIDLFLSNAGNTVPRFILRGDLHQEQTVDSEWALLRNDGNFIFTNITRDQRMKDGEFSWGALFEDMNLDGELDLLVMENSIKWTAHKLRKAPGRFFIQHKGNFYPVTKATGLTNEYFGQAPLAADFNNDGYPDLVFINLDGPLRVFINNGGTNNYLTVRLPDRAEGLGSRVVVTKNDGSTLTRQFMTGLGFMSDTTPDLTFGLGSETNVSLLQIFWPNGKITTIPSPKINTVIVP